MKNKEELKKWMILIVFTIGVYWLVNNLEIVFGIVSKFINVMLPFILGIALAYI